jgi:hypothetical protein
VRLEELGSASNAFLATAEAQQRSAEAVRHRRAPLFKRSQRAGPRSRPSEAQSATDALGEHFCVRVENQVGCAGARQRC